MCAHCIDLPVLSTASWHLPRSGSAQIMFSNQDFTQKSKRKNQHKNMMCCHPVPHSCMEKIYMSTCRNLLLLPPLCHCSASSIYWLSYQSVRTATGINISIARKWHIRMRAAIRRMRARRACRPVTIYGKEEEKRRKRPKADRSLEFSQALLSFTKTIFCPNLCSERNRLFSSSQKLFFAQIFAQKETGPSFAQSRPPHQDGPARAQIQIKKT